MKEQPGFPAGRQKKLVFGNYDLVRRIDVGGMGEVYLARQRTAFGREVAIKIIRPDLVDDAVARQRFQREAEINAKLLHEHIPSFIEFNVEHGQLFFVTPFISGGTLAQRLQAGPIPASETYQLFTALLRAVAYIHRHGVVHRDLKPSNILLDTEMEPGQVYVRLIDFGIASNVGMTSADPRLTKAGTEMGTIEYMAPERALGISAPSNDIYSLGIILYQMLTGKLPSDQNIKLPAPLEYVVNRATALNPNDRFASAKDMQTAFEDAYKSLNAPRAQQGAQQLQFIPTPVRASAASPESADKQEVRILSHSGDVPVLPRSPSGFDHADYASPTVSVGNMVHLPVQAAQAGQVRPASGATSTASMTKAPPTRPPKRRRSPLLAVVTIFMIVVLLAMGGIFYFAFQAGSFVSATVNFAPKVVTLSQVYHLKASLSQRAIDVKTQTIPLKTLPDSQSGSLSGQTTGKICFIPPVFFCHQVVSSTDVATLTAEEQQNLDKTIEQTLQQQLAAKQGSAVGAVQYLDGASTANPTVGTASKTVTVTINDQQGTETYYLNSDAQALAQQLVEQQIQQLGANYRLVAGTMQTGIPAYQGVDGNGQVLLAVAAGAVAEYHFPSAQLHHIAAAIVNMKQSAALAYIKREPGIAPSTVSISLSMGSTLPGNSQSIKLVPLNASSIPSVSLPQVTPVSTQGT
jgi:serine/threonine protein kinase